MGKITLFGFIIVPKNDLATVESELATHIEHTRQEAGCLTFNVVRSQSDECRFDVMETFESRTAFEHHQNRVTSSRWGEVTVNVERHYQIVEEPEEGLI
ncbi:MAG: antibiotic biosynthesis monooxygenase [Cyanobacteria bacterium J06554_11]